MFQFSLYSLLSVIKKKKRVEEYLLSLFIFFYNEALSFIVTSFLRFLTPIIYQCMITDTVLAWIVKLNK